MLQQHEQWDEMQRPMKRHNRRRHISRSPSPGSRVVMQIPALLVLWMDYTKVFYKVRETYRVKVLFRKFDVEIQGQRNQVNDAHDYLKDMIKQYDYVELPIEDQKSNNRSIYRPFIEVTHTRDFEQMQQKDKRLCMLVPYKVAQLSLKMKNQFRFEGVERERRYLPYNYVLLFCKKNNQESYQNKIMEVVNMLRNLLQNDITPMQAPRFNSRGMMNFRADYYKDRKSINVDKMDAIWLSQFDKLQLLSKKNQVYITMQDTNKPETVQVIITSNKISMIEQTFKSILDGYLRTFMMHRIEYEFPPEVNFQEVVTREMREYITEGIKQRKPLLAPIINNHRFIDSNTMYITAQELDDYYKTTIVDHLDHKQGSSKYLYVLGVNELFPHITELSLKYLQENKLQKQAQSEIIQVLPQQSYLQNDYDESVIIERESDLHESEIERIHSAKKFKVIDQQETSFTVVVYNTSEERFLDERFLDQSDLSRFLRQNRCQTSFMVSQKNKTLTLDVEDSNSQQFISLLEIYFNHSIALNISSKFYEQVVANPSTITNILNPSSAQYQLIKVSQKPSNDTFYFNDNPHFNDLISHQNNDGPHHYLLINNLPYQERQTIKDLIHSIINNPE